jgi:hypothetical protein
VSYLRSFAPWIAFAVVPASQWKWAALFALVISIVGITRQARAGLPFDAQIIEAGSAVYFAGLTALAFADPKTPLHSYTACLASGALGLIALASIAVRKPFTLGIAKQTMPPQVWDNPLFYRVNVIISSVWAASFVVGCVLLGLLAHSNALARSVVQVAAFALPLVFTLCYVDHVRSRARAAEMASA